MHSNFYSLKTRCQNFGFPFTTYRKGIYTAQTLDVQAIINSTTTKATTFNLGTTADNADEIYVCGIFLGPFFIQSFMRYSVSP